MQPTVPIAKAAMMIRKPVAEVFSAFIDPAVTSRFWFTGGSGALVVGREVTWEWAMYEFSLVVEVRAVEENKRIEIEWPGDGGPTTVEWRFTALADGHTFVEITNCGFGGDDAVQQAIDATEGFTLVLAGAKAWLEHGLQLNLVLDRFPQGLPAG